ncbi:hypothetical protein [Rhodococcus sp. OK519]|uniref:hypothetical protein n=1 Tax=Rhodococcus sp. OK519 TaxID=2135729 RepID=UPI000D3978AF
MLSSIEEDEHLLRSGGRSSRADVGGLQQRGDHDQQHSEHDEHAAAGGECRETVRFRDGGEESPGQAPAAQQIAEGVTLPEGVSIVAAFVREEQAGPTAPPRS